MEALAIVVMLLALLALAGVVTFFVWDYFKHKDENDRTFAETKQRVDAEKKDRLSNIKFVVDQVNEVNKDIYTTMTSNVNVLRGDTSQLKGTQMGLLDGIDKFLRFSSNNPITGAPQPLSILSLPGSTSPNVELIQNVSAVMGLTAVDLSKTKQVKLCGTDRTKCIQFPNEDGNTYITSLSRDASSKVILDAPTRVTGPLDLAGTMFVPNSTINSLSIQAGGNVGIGSTGFSNPQAKLHVQGTSGDIFKVSTNNSDVILVTATGDIEMKGNNRIIFKNPSGTSVASVGIGTTGNVLTVRPEANGASILLDGNVAVNGTLTTTKLNVTSTTPADAIVGGKQISTVNPPA